MLDISASKYYNTKGKEVSENDKINRNGMSHG